MRDMRGGGGGRRRARTAVERGEAGGGWTGRGTGRGTNRYGRDGEGDRRRRRWRRLTKEEGVCVRGVHGFEMRGEGRERWGGILVRGNDR